MSGDAFKKITPGTTEPGFPAGLRNGLVDLLRGSTVSMGENTPRIDRNNTIIPVVNNTGGNLEQFAVVGLDDVTYDPDVEAQSAAFFHDRCMSAVTPEFDNGHVTRFGVVQEPITSGATGLCAVAGFTPIMLAVNKTWHNYAVPIDGSVDNMETAPYGAAIIQWASGGEGGEADWALVSMKSGVPAILLGVAVTNWHKADDDWCYVNVYPCSDFAGTGADTDNEIKVWLPRNGMDRDPNVENGDVIQCMLLDASASTPEAVCVSNYLDSLIGNYKFVLHSATRPHPYVPRGWMLTFVGFNGRCLMFNDDADIPFGVDGGAHYHPFEVEPPGAPHNDHNRHMIAPSNTNVYHSGTGVTGIQGILTSDYDFSHSQTSNWPPYAVLDMITRYDNSE